MRKEKNNKAVIYVAIFIAFIMVTSIAGYILGNQTGTTTDTTSSYNGYGFSRTSDNRWSTKINGVDVQFDYHPLDLEFINLSSQIKDEILSSKMVYVTYSQNETDVQKLGLAQYELAQELSMLKIYAIPAMTEANQYNLSVVGCENATRYVPVVLLENSFDNQITVTNNCIVLDGDPQKMTDRLAYSLFGVMK